MAITDEHLHKLSLFDWHLEHGADYQKYALYGLGAGALASCFYGKESNKRTWKHAAKFGAVGAGVGIAAVFLLFKAGALISDKSHEIVRAGFGRGRGWDHGGRGGREDHGRDHGFEHRGYRAGNEAALGYGMDPVGAFRAGNEAALGYGMDPVGAFRAGMRRGWGHGGGGGGWGHGGHRQHGWGGGGGGGGEGGGEGGEGGGEEGGFGPEEPGHSHEGWHHPEHHHHGWRR